MSRQSTERIRCQACGHEQDFAIWPSLNTGLDPDIKQQLVDGTLLTFTCSQCGDVARVEYNLLYHDMDTQWLIWMLPNGDWPDTAKMSAFPRPIFENASYRLRVVRSFNELLEKVHIADAKLDDLVVEVLKIFLWQNIREEEGIDDGILLFSGLRDGDKGRELTFVLLSEHKKGRFSIPYGEFYENLLTEHPEAFVRPPGIKSNWIQVDAAYALQCLEK